VGDIILICTGGNPIAPGQPIPTANFSVTLGTQVTSRILGTNGVSNASEALLLIDEPGVANGTGAGTQLGQTLCTTPTTGCAAFVGTTGATLGNAVTTNNGTAPAANVYQGLVNANSFQVNFLGVPVLPPVSAGVTRVFRITNIRANAAGVPSGLGGIGQLLASVSISGSSSIGLPAAVVTVGFVQPGLTTAVRAFGGANSTSNASTSGLSFLQCNSVTTRGVAVLQYRENFGTAFKTRVNAASPGAGGSAQSGTAIQNIPGAFYDTESGFTTSAVAGAGLADFGTRLRAVFNNVPNGVRIFVSTTNISGTNTVAGVNTSGNYAVQVFSETAPETNGVPAAFSTGTLNSGALTYSEIPIVNGTGTAVWEVVATNRNAIDTLDFAVYTSFTGNQGNNTPPAGISQVNMSYAPIFNTGGATASSTLPIPRFVDNSTGANFLRVTLCQTTLLFPFVTNASGLETGIAISNTSRDVFSTTPQQGTCTLTFFGNQTIAAFTTPVIQAGDANTTTTDWAFTLSSVPGAATGFQGYTIAQCNFQFAHGFAFISDIGARNLAMGYLALVMNTDSSLSLNRGSASESFTH